MDLRDELAVQRTILANQRTLLTFFNAALALLISGVTLIKLVPGDFIYWLGWAFIVSSALMFSIGVKNFCSHKRTIEAAYKKSEGG